MAVRVRFFIWFGRVPHFLTHAYFSKLCSSLFEFFAVPSENKRDVRSIEETLNDIRKRKKFRSDDGDDDNEDDSKEDE